MVDRGPSHRTARRTKPFSAGTFCGRGGPKAWRIHASARIGLSRDRQRQRAGAYPYSSVSKVRGPLDWGSIGQGAGDLRRCTCQRDWPGIRRGGCRLGPRPRRAPTAPATASSWRGTATTGAEESLDSVLWMGAKSTWGAGVGTRHALHRDRTGRSTGLGLTHRSCRGRWGRRLAPGGHFESGRLDGLAHTRWEGATG